MASLLDMFGTGGTQTLGLLGGDVEAARNDAQAQALYALAGSLLSGGPTGLSIARGLQQGQQAYRQAMRGSLDEQLQNAQVQEMMRRRRLEEEALRRQQIVDTAVARSFRPGVAAQPAQFYGEESQMPLMDDEGNLMPGASLPVQAQAPRFDIQGIAPALMASPEGRKTLADLVAAQKAMRPETFSLAEGVRQFERDPITGEVRQVATGTQKPQQFKQVDLGNVVVMLDDSGKEVMRMPKGRAPEGPVALQTVETEQGIMTFNPRTGQLTPLTQDGKPLMGKGAKPTVDQLNAAGYASRMVAANQIVNSPEISSAAPGVGSALAGSVPFIGESLKSLSQSPATQQYSQAARDWIRAKLRKESGAAIGVAEEENEFRTYFPVVGDSPAVIRQKAEARERANQGMIQASGNAFKPPVMPINTGDLASQARAELERRRKGQ